MRKILIAIMVILGISHSQDCDLLTYTELDQLRESHLIHPRNGLKCEKGYFYNGLADKDAVIGAKITTVMTYCACLNNEKNIIILNYRKYMRLRCKI